MTLLADIQSRLHTASDDARIEGVAAIYHSNTPESERKIEEIILSPDPILKILLTRYLSAQPTEKAVSYLIRILEDANQTIHEVARRAFEKNGYDKKWTKLISLTHSSNLNAQYYAIDKLAQAYVVEALPLFLSMLSAADEPLLIHILQGLRYFPDERILPVIKEYFMDPREEVRFRAVMVCGALYESGIGHSRRLFLSALTDTSGKIRRAVIWGLRRVPLKKDLKIVLDMAKTDPDPHVRQEALLNLHLYPYAKVIFFLLEVLSQEKEKMVLLKAYGVLNAFPRKFLAKVLWKAIRKKKGKQKGILLMAELHEESGWFVDYLLRQSKRTRDPKEKLVFLQALGITEDVKAIPVLQGAIRGEPLTAYTAVGSLLKIWKRHPDRVPIDQYLDAPDCSSSVKQAILKQVLKSEQWEKVQSMEPILIKLAQEENLNIRYLATQILVFSDSHEAVFHLVQMILDEKDPVLIDVLREGLGRYLITHPEKLDMFLEKYWAHERAINFFFSILPDLAMGPNQTLELLQVLIQKFKIHMSHYKDLFCHLVGSIMGLFSHDKFLRGVEGIEDRDQLLCLLVQSVRMAGTNLNLPAGLLEDWFESESPLGKKAIIDLLVLAGSESSIRFLVWLVCQDKKPSYQAQASIGLGEIIHHYD